MRTNQSRNPESEAPSPRLVCCLINSRTIDMLSGKLRHWHANVSSRYIYAFVCRQNRKTQKNEQIVVCLRRRFEWR